MSDDWHYSHTNSSGYNVNAYGRDQNGVYRGTEQNNYNPSQNTSSSSGSRAKAGAGGGLGGLILFLIAMKFIIDFIKANWVSLMAIIVICITCAVVISRLRRNVRRPGLGIFLTVVGAVGLIYGVLNFGIMRHDGNFNNFNLGQIIKPIASKKPAVVKEDEVKAIYAYINIDQLNLRSGPSVSNDIIRALSKDTRIEVIDDSGIWWKIRHENTEGYVNSEYLRKE
jgi:hypothetical protein